MAENSESFGSEIIKFYKLNPRRSEEKEFEKIYQLPLQPRYRDEEKKLRICQFGNPRQNSEPINILVIGATGSGKSTAVNALINYLANVGFEDDHRLEIVSLEESERSRKGHQTESQTDWITVYEIGQFGDVKQDCQVNIVDTPGFGDTRGKARDEETFNQIRHLFQYGLTTVHAVCIAMHGTETRLTDRQKYIFDSVMKVFGKDIKNNLYIWATFTDDENPPVLDGFKNHGIHYQDHFTFENGALFRKLSEDKRNRMKYKGNFEDVYKTFDRFFKKIKNTSPQSLENSQQVLEERNKLCNHQAMIEKDIVRTLQCLKDQKMFERAVVASEQNVLYSQNCFFDVTVTERCGKKVYNCEDCKITCCDPCSHGFFERFSFDCKNLNWSGYCNVCRCHSRRHEHSKFKRYTMKRISLSEIDNLQMNNPSVMILNNEKQNLINKAKYFVEVAQIDKNAKQQVLDNTVREITVLENNLRQNLVALHEALLKLQNIALYEERTTVSQILQEIEDGDRNRSDPETVNIYRKLREFISQNRL